MPRSLVARSPVLVERLASKRDNDMSVRAWQLGSPQHEAKSAASLEAWPVRAGQEGAEPFQLGRRPWKTPGILERVSRNPPA